MELLIGAVCLVSAAACLILAAVLDAPLLAVAGVGFLAIVAASHYVGVSDPITGGLVVIWFAVSVVFGVINARSDERGTPLEFARSVARDHGHDPDQIACGPESDGETQCSGDGEVMIITRSGNGYSAEGAYFSRTMP